MNEVIEQELNGVVSFKHAKVRLNKNKITFINGLNRDAEHVTGNGAGKSLFFSAPSNIFYFSPPLAIRKKAKKELLGKNSSIRLKFKSFNGNVYDITQEASKYTILENGKDIEIRTQPLAEAFIRRVFPLSEIEYYTHAYVSTQKPFPMQNASDADRLNCLSTIFQLDNYDKIKRYFLDRLAEIRDSELQLQHLERELLAVNKQLKSSEPSSFDIGDTRSKHKKLVVELEDLNRREHEAHTNIKHLATLKTVEAELDVLRAKYTTNEHPAARIKYLKNIEENVREYANYLKLKEAHEDKLHSLKKKIKSIGTLDSSAKELKAKLEKYENRIETLTSSIKEAEKDRKNAEELQEKAKRLNAHIAGIEVDLKSDYASELHGYKATLKLKKLLSADHNHKDNTKCPTCLSKVDLKSIRDAVKRAEKMIPRLEKQIKAQESALELKVVNKQLKEIGDSYTHVYSLIDKRTKLNTEIADIEEQIDKHSELKKLKALLADMEKSKPKEIEKPEGNYTIKKIKEEIELCTDVLSHLNAKKKLIENNPELEGYKTVKQVNAALHRENEVLITVKSLVETKRKKAAELAAIIEKANRAKHEREIFIKQRDKVQSKIGKLKPAVENKRVLEVLAKVYGSKGLKVNMANEICALLEQNLNAYRHLIFMEPFVFSVRAHEQGISITVDRGKGHVSDVRNLSGAESNCFRLLFVLALLPLVPADRRVNYLILDEPCSHQDEVPRQKFLSSFLPVLSEVVPNIYVITPNTGDYCEGSNKWIVRKQQGVSEVITKLDSVELGG